MAIYLQDDVVMPGRAVRSVIIDSAADLSYEEPDEGEVYAELETNRGTVECAIGTLATTADLSVIKRLGSSGWVDIA